MLVIAAALLVTAGCASPAPGGSTDAAGTTAPARPTPAETPAPAPVDVPDPLSPSVQAQVDYVLTYWQQYNSAEYGVVTDNDCVNFTSQSLIARGWQQDDAWYHDSSDVYGSSASWLSSTAMRNWLRTRPDLAIALDDSQRAQVKVGDIVQFDWDNSGDRDHTGVVTKVETTDAGTKIYFAGHTLDSDYRSVDDAITIDHPGGTAYYWSIQTA